MLHCFFPLYFFFSDPYSVLFELCSGILYSPVLSYLIFAELHFFCSLCFFVSFVIVNVCCCCSDRNLFSRLHKSMIFLHSSFYHSQILIYCPITISLYTAFFTSSLHNDKMSMWVCVCVWECFRGRRWQRQQKFRISPTG